MKKTRGSQAAGEFGGGEESGAVFRVGKAYLDGQSWLS